MKKRILSIVLSIVMLVSLLPTTALAMPSHSHCVCGGSVTVGGHTHENITSWVAWDGKDRDSETPGDQLTAGSYYLNDNVDVDVTIVGEVNLCLNGHTITTNDSYGAFYVKSGATLNICDCSTTQPGEIKNTNASDDYPGIYNYGGTVNVYSGTVSGADTGIRNNGGTVNVYGGTVSGADTGIKNEQNSNLNIYNGTAQATGSTGYGIYNQGTVSVSGGIVTSRSNGIHNYYTGTINVSGTVQVSGSTAIYNGGGTVTVSGGTVTATGSSGSGIDNSGTGTLTVSGGTVTANNGSSKGISNSGTLNLQGAPSITGAAADIYLVNNKVINISGALTYGAANAISVKMATPGTFTSGWTFNMGGNAANYGSYFTSANDGYIVQPDGIGELKLAEPPAAETHSHDMSVECGNTDPRAFTAWDGTTTPTGNVYLTNDVNRAITISSGTVNLCLNGHSITRSGNSTITVSEGATLNICDCSTGETGGKIANTYSSSQGRGINNSGTVNVYGGTIEATGLMGRGIYNDGSGTINFSGGSVSGKSYGIYNNGTGAVNIIGGNVNEGIYNSSTGAVTVSGGTVESTIYGIHNNGAGTIVVSGGSVSGDANGISNNNGGIVTVSGGNVSSERGHGIFSGSSQNTVTVTDGSITASSSECYGIYNSYGKVTVSGGSVTATGSDGRGIYNDSGTLTVIGGSITATGPESYGIENRFSNSFALSGAPAVSGTAADVYLFSEVVITIADALTTYAPENAISVKWEKWDDDYNKVSVSGTFTSGWTTNMGNNAANYGSYFTSANSGYTVQPDGSGELKLAEPPAIPVESVSLDKSSLTLDVGGTATLTATVLPDDATDKTVSWSSNNESVATVADGVVSAVGEGTATITATTEDGGFTDTCTVTVVPVHEHPNCGVANCTNTTHNHSEVDEWTELTKENIKTYVTKSGSSYILTPGSYYLGEDITLSDVANDCTFIYMIASGTYNVCLNGNTITGSGSAPVFRANDTNAVLSICDCSEPSTGKITGGKNGGVYIDDGTVNLYGGSITGNTVYQQGAGVYVSSGTFNMYGGSITNNTFISGSDRKGGGVYVSSGTFNMSGGTISDHVSSNGGGVYVASGTFNMYGGTISGNTASTYGGGVYVYSGTFTMTGGKITGNSANNYSGGVYNQGGTFNVSGSPVVTDNKVGTAENNIYCANDITIIGALTAEAQIGVNYYSETTFTSGWTAAMGESETDYEKYFTSDNSGFEIVKNDSGELELKKPTIPVTDVVLDKSSITLDVNGTAELAATVLPDDATDKTVSWTSSDPTVAKVENGLVTALNPGSTTITATANDGSGKSATCSVTVNKIAITGPIAITTTKKPTVGQEFSLDYIVIPDGNYRRMGRGFSPQLSIEAGKDYTLSVELKPNDGYYFADGVAATVNGKAATVVRSGDNISIKYTYSFASPAADSVDILLSGISADTASILLPGINENAATMDFTAKTLDQYGQEMTGQTVEWSITGTNTTGISVNNGTVTVTKDAAVGNYTLTATCDGKSDSITIKVEKAESVATSIKIFKGENEVTADTIYIPEQYRNTVNYTAVVYDQYGEVMSADDAEITKTHKNTTATGFGSAEVNNRSWNVYVDASTGKAGSFDLVLTSGNASASVHITFAYLETQTITCANVTGTYGQTEELKLNPSGKQTAGAYKFAIKSGASTDVVEVASDGKLTIKNAGETTIVVTAPGDATHASASVEVNVTIYKADITEYTEPTSKDLTYNGSAQALITEGSATGGSMMYAIGTAEQATGEWSTDTPTGTDIGTYYVWYKIVGDGNHNNKTFETPITVTIAPNTYIVTYLPGINGTGPQTTATKTQGIALMLEGATFTRTGYTQTGWATTDGGAQVYALGASYTADSPITLYPVWTANTNTAYTVEHWQQNVERTDYVKVDTDEKTGTTGAETVAAAKTYTGFTAQSFNQVAIAADGGTVVKIYYNRNTYTVTYTDNGVFLSNVTFEDVVYGAKAPAYPDTPTRPGYTFGGWYKDSGLTTAWDFENDTINGPTTIYAKWTEKNAVSITETAQTYTWDGNPKSFAITGTPNTGFTVQYKFNGNWTTTAPSAVGTYDVKITRAEDDTYKAYEKIITGGLVINAATPTATAPTAKTGLVYDGNAKSLINAGTSEHGYWEYSLDGTSYSSDIPTDTDAKTYTVYCRFVPNTGYSEVNPVQFSVTIAPLAIDEPTVNDSYIYTGSEQTVTLNGFNDSYMTIAGNKGTNAGGYKVVITLNSNHAWKSGSDGRVQWSIGKAEPTVTWPTGTAYVNDTSVTLTGGSAAGVGTETSVEGSFTLEAVDLTSVGTKTVKITFAPNSTNYKNVEKTDYSVTVSKRTVESVAEQTAVENAVYGTEQDALGLPASVEITVSGNKMFTVPVTWSGYDATNLNAQTLTGTLDLTDIAAEVQQPNPAITASIVVDLQEKNAATFNYENKTETYNGSSISHEISGTLEGVASISYSYVGSEYAASSTAPTNAGVYEVTATFTMQPGYAAVAPKTATLTISPKEVGLDWSELTGEELVYSGTAKALTATATGLADGDSCTVTVELVGDNINVGTFSYEATALSNQNYKLPVDVSSPEYTITPKTLTITADSHEVYVGSRQPELTYTIDGLVGTDTLTTAPTLSTDANMYRAGTYAITFASEAAAGNNYSITYVNGTLTVKNYPYIPQPTYDVEIADDITGGDVSASKKLAYRGDTITIIVAPNAGYELAKLTVADSRNNVVAVTKISDSKYTFKMPGYDVEIDAVFAKIDTTCPGDSSCPMYPYTDLDRSLWYHDGIHYCIEHGLMVGTGTNIFEPNIATSRAMIVTILWRLEGSPVVNYAMDFEDVAADQWYTEAIRWAASEKIVEGYGNGQFGTNDAITREQMVTIMFRYAKYKGYDVSVGENTNILSYDDAFDVAEWAIPAMQWACGSGMIQGIADGNQMNLAPQGNATRAQAAAILQRFCENVANKE